MRRTYSVVLKRQALEDILQIATYIADQSHDPYVAELWEDSIYQHLKHLENFPKGYPQYPRRPYRKLVHGRYLILYRVDDEALRVHVCRVVHGARLPRNIGSIEPDE